MEEIKPCLECGKMHTRRKFCAKKIRASYPKCNSTNVDTIIRGQNSPIQDTSFNFVFSNKLGDWTSSKNKSKREEYQERRQHKLNTNEDG